MLFSNTKSLHPSESSKCITSLEQIVRYCCWMLRRQWYTTRNSKHCLVLAAMCSRHKAHTLRRYTNLCIMAKGYETRQETLR